MGNLKGQFLLILIVALIIPFISAESIGTFKVNEPMQITNYCQAGVCTYVTLVSLEYPNGTIIYPDTNMTQNNQVYNYSFTPTEIGEYTFVTCGDSTIAVCDSDTFDATYTGKEVFVGINIMLLIFFSLLMVGVISLNRKINYEKWYNSMLNKYKEKNFVKFTLSIVAYNLLKNTFAIYYVIGLPIMVLLTDMVYNYNIISFLEIAEALLFIYTWGVVIVALILMGQFQEFIHKLLKDVRNIKWGFGDGE